jgi:hypothetical protein
MSTQTPSRNAPGPQVPDGGAAATQQMPSAQARDRSNMAPEMGRQMDRLDDMRAESRMHTETKPAIKSTELYIYLAAVGGVLLASELVGKNSVGVDIFRANNAWLFITLLTIGYLVSRGLSKAGSSWRNADRR